MNEKTVSLCIRCGKVTANLLKSAMVKALAKMEQEKKQQGQKTNQKQSQKEKEDKTYKGKQSLDKLMKQNVQLSNIEITDGNIKSFERVAKKYRHGMEYGSARWGTPKDIEPFMAPKFADNIILTKTERLMMSNRPPDPKNARNKNVLVVGGSGSGKTRFWLKPNLLQCHSSYVVTDPKGTIVLECGQAMLKNGYKVKVLNTINFKKSMHYNPFSYVHSEKDILKLVTTLMTNTKGEGSGGDPFWEKSERLLLTALIAYLHYEAPVEEQNFATLLEMLNTMQVLEDDEEYQNPVDLLFEELAKKKPNSFAGRQYKLYKLAAGDICSK